MVPIATWTEGVRTSNLDTRGGSGSSYQKYSGLWDEKSGGGMQRNALIMPRMLLLLGTAILTSTGYAQDPRRGASLDPILQPYLERYDLPALAAAIIKNGEIIASGAVGTRRAGTNNPVMIEDRFHIGSDTKAMTALIAAMLVEAGKLRWTSTVAEVFPELAATMDPALKGVTLEQLLSHTSGIPSDTDADEQLILQSFTQDRKSVV